MAQKIITPQGVVYLDGSLTDGQTRCVHYHSGTDVIAIRFKCCNTYYPCYQCHAELAGHEAVLWEKTEHQQLAVLCGVCKNQLTIAQYLACANKCPACGVLFNPNCSRHYHLYFRT